MTTNVVMDTNVIVSAFLSPAGAPANLFRLLEQDRFTLVVSRAILDEYKRALQYEKVRKLHKLSPEQITQAIDELSTAAKVVEPAEQLAIVAGDSDDNKLFECALAGGAPFIISGDVAVQAIKEYRGIRVLSPAMFVALLNR
jgi:putative PIN family toxin of toxin-antitoxin system